MPKITTCSENKELFINNNLLVKSSVEALTSKITENWISLKENNTEINKSSRKSITDFIQKLCRKEINPTHACWTTNSHVVPYFIKHIINKSNAQKKTNSSKQMMNKFLIDDIIFGKLANNVSDDSLYTLGEENYLPFVYATLNLEIESDDLHKIVYKHLECYNVNKYNLDYKHYLEEVYRRKDELKLSTPLLEQILLTVPTILEEQIIDFIQNLCKSQLSNYTDINISLLQKTIMLSKKSQICFQICSKILNTLFIETNCSQLLFVLIQMFINEIRKDISLTQYLLLYPDKYHKLIRLMEMSDFSKNNNELCDQFKILVQNDPENFAFMLLTHYPKCFLILYDELVSNLELDNISI